LQVFGFSDFKGSQRAVVSSLLARRDVLYIAATGTQQFVQLLLRMQRMMTCS
jgi:hypothetical protein